LVRGREGRWCVMIIQPRDAGTPQHHGVAHVQGRAVQGRAPRSPRGGLQLYDSSPTTTTAPLHTFGVCSCSSTPPKVAATAGGLQLYDSSPTTTTAPLHTFGVCSCSSTPPNVAATAGDTSVQPAERGVCSCSCSSTPPNVAATAGDTSVQLAERGVCSCSSECVMGLSSTPPTERGVCSCSSGLGPRTSSTPPAGATSSRGATTAGDASLATAALTCVQLAERLRAIPGAAEWGDVVVPVFVYSEVGGADVARYLDSDSSLLGFLQRELGIVKATASVAGSIRAHLLKTSASAAPSDRTTSASAQLPDRTS
jgi:hypothetical protein